MQQNQSNFRQDRRVKTDVTSQNPLQHQYRC